ncbi:MAG TPA: hypothetical protein VG538_01465 [Vicinamibacterales bacterium]|jgi:hypothetical protein|nr:hypothetical protein [Vicinamibacterales bacterium]
MSVPSNRSRPRPAISRVLVIVLAFIVAGVQARAGAWVEASGLVALGAGLIILHLAQTRPRVKPLAWLAFAVTAAAMVVVALRSWPRS